MVEKKLKADIDYVEKNKKDLLKEHLNKYVLVHEQKIVDSFDNYQRAAEEGVRLFGTDGVFLVYQILDKEPVNFVMEAAL
ncbi:hypothetical protein KAX75_00750 [candidate division WOR-3 bacterium]|nr:hypothetical protein [candidate division WOR-3 bacterium]